MNGLMCKGPYCQYCNEIVKTNQVHHCLIFINGIPAPGGNHLKHHFQMSGLIYKAE